MPTRSEIEFFLRANRDGRSEDELRRELLSRGVSDVDFYAALEEVTLYPDGRPAAAVKPNKAGAPRWAALAALAVAASLALWHFAGRTPAAPAPAETIAGTPVPVVSDAVPRHFAVPTTWKIGGRAYDLSDLKPIASATLTFTRRDNGESFRAKTDQAGRYAISLPVPETGTGYDLKVRAKGYRPEYLDEADKPYSEQPAQTRRLARALLRDTRILHVPIVIEDFSGRLTQNVILDR